MIQQSPQAAATSAPCRHMWITKLGGALQRCEHCGKVRRNPGEAQAEAREARDMNRMAP